MSGKHINGPGIFLAQFLGDKPPFDNLQNISRWASKLGFTGVQIPGWDTRVIDLNIASKSKDYCDSLKGMLRDCNMEIIELAAYLQGQCMAMHPAYEKLFQPFYPKGLDDRQRMEWATLEIKKTIDASVFFGTTNISVLSGSLAWPYIYPWPQRSEGLIEEAFNEIAKRWLPILDYAQDHGMTIGFELHPGSDLFDGATYKMFLELVEEHPSACITYDPSHFLLQQADYIQFIELFSDRITAFHVKDAEFNPSGLGGVYGSYANWDDRPGRFRSPGDGQIDFKRIFTLLAERGYNGWSILEWECCIKSPEQGAREAATFIKNHIIETTDRAFDDFTKSATNSAINKQILGLSS
ncbi:sugar phosphate isomerase/epimerase [Flavobacteriaceae bacterium F89]|uniref:Sugar phosphate isomerase/epimerase n=1 Tax=Cerina litoralis TaxID=2874477 RepID=A0AAE3EXQ3_9FLAO|nr:sugar phosphate isomerase/epimerase [Cerina litoralis]MCG2461632.1 sugar phosphate isomerase/epimerase [Cerina litoralis]